MKATSRACNNGLSACGAASTTLPWHAAPSTLCWFPNTQSVHKCTCMAHSVTVHQLHMTALPLKGGFLLSE